MKVTDLIEKLRSVKLEVIDDDDWDSRCVFVDMRPDDFEALLTEAAAALEAAREDAARLAFLAGEPVIEGFVGDEKDIYDYAFDAAEESGRDEPNEADMLAGLRRMIDAAIDRTRGKGA